MLGVDKRAIERLMLRCIHFECCSTKRVYRPSGDYEKSKCLHFLKVLLSKLK